MESKTILLVEDNSDDEALTLRALKKNNIKNEVVIARDGAEALEYLFRHRKYAGATLVSRRSSVVGFETPESGRFGSLAPSACGSAHQASTCCDPNFFERRAGPNRRLRAGSK